MTKYSHLSHPFGADQVRTRDAKPNLARDGGAGSVKGRMTPVPFHPGMHPKAVAAAGLGGIAGTPVNDGGVPTSNPLSKPAPPKRHTLDGLGNAIRKAAGLPGSPRFNK